LSEQFGRILIIIGGVLAVSGLVIILLGRLVNLNDLPGTIKIENGNFRLVIPIAASIVLSLILTIILNVIARLLRR
jgi:hypothetical protein